MIYDWHRLGRRHGAEEVSDAPDLSSSHVASLGRAEAGSAFARMAEDGFNRALVERPLLVARAVSYRAPGAAHGTENFEGGRASGVVYVVKGNTLLCQVPFDTESSMWVRDGDQGNDLEGNVELAIRKAVGGTGL